MKPENSTLIHSPYPSWWWDYWMLVLALVYPSISLFKKGGWPLMGLYGVSAIAGLFFLLRVIFPAIKERMTARICTLLVMAAFMTLALAFAWAFPVIQEQQVFKILGWKIGVSDSNDAYVATWRAMLAGKYPYYEKSFLGNQISPMPGALLIAFPFYLLGQPAWQNVFWLVVFWAVLGWHAQDWRIAGLIILIAFLTCPNLPYIIIQGGDYTTNSIYVLVAGLGLLHCLERPSKAKWSYLFAAGLGVGLSSRANYLLVVPILFFAAMRLTGWKAAIWHFAICLGVFGLITLPFYLYDPAHFSPLHTRGKLDLNGLFPHASELIFLGGCGLAFIMGICQKQGQTREEVFAQCFYVQIFVVLSGLPLALANASNMLLIYPHFAMLATFFGVFGFGPRLLRTALAL